MDTMHWVGGGFVWERDPTVWLNFPRGCIEWEYKLKERPTTNLCILRKTHFCVFLKRLGKLSDYHGNTKECHEFYCKLPGCLHAERCSQFPMRPDRS